MAYNLSLFLHIVGACLLAGAYAFEWLCLIQLRNAESIREAGKAAKNFSVLRIFGTIAVALVLLPGIAMTALSTVAAWIVVGFAGLVIMGAVGGMIGGKKMKLIEKTVSEQTALTPAAREQFNDDSLMFSLRLRSTVFAGVVYIMTLKPGLAGSLIALAVSIVIGLFPLPSGVHQEMEKNLGGKTA